MGLGEGMRRYSERRERKVLSTVFAISLQRGIGGRGGLVKK
jgi:hypothetical protein